MIFLDKDENKLMTPLILSWERILEVNQIPVLNILVAGSPIDKGCRVVYFDDDNKPNEFIVVEVTEVRQENLTKLLYCHGSETMLSGKFIEDRRPNGNIDSAVSILLEGTEFSVGTSEDLGVYHNRYYRETSLEAFARTLKNYNAEYETEYLLGASNLLIGQRKINLKKQIGRDMGRRCTYNKDMTMIERKVLESPVVTKLYPFGKGEAIGDGYGRRITIKSVNDDKLFLEDNDLRLLHGIGKDRLHFESYVIFENIEDPTELLAAAQEYFEELKVQKVSYSGNILDMAAMGFPHEGVKLGDWVTITDSEFQPPLEIKARVVKLIEHKGYKDITLGNYIPFFEDTQKDIKQSLKGLLDRAGGWDNASVNIESGSYLDNVLDVLNSQLNIQGGWAQLIPGRGIIIPNAQNEEDATLIVEIGGGYIRYANSRLPNGEWDYRNISDANGVVADSITTGILQGGKVQLNLETGTFLIGNSPTDHLLYFDGSNLSLNPDSFSLVVKDEVASQLSDPVYREELESYALGEIDARITTYSSEVDQRFDNITTTFTGVATDIGDLSNELQTALDTISTYIRFDINGIELGELGNPIKLFIENDRIVFTQNDVEVAYIDDNKLYITDGQFLNSLRLGEFAFIPRSNGNLSFGKVI